MYSDRRNLSAAILILTILTITATSVNAQTVQVVPHPDHPDPYAIYLVSSRISVEITAGVAHTTLTQVFTNPNEWQAEGTYLFPLPEGAAVTDFKLTMDGVEVSGEVLDRQKAADIYMGIVRRIRDPALLEYVGNRVFRARIFPFASKGDRTLTLSYAQVLPREGDYHVFRYLTGQGSSLGAVNRQPRRISGMSTRSDLQDVWRDSRFVLEGTIEDERPVRSVYSPTHPVALDRSDPKKTSFSAEGALDNRRGFTLFYSLGEDEDIGLSLLAHKPEAEDGYFLLTITPGWQRRIRRIPRDIIFVLDTSGSMDEDNKLENAVEALKFGLGTLNGEDRFGLITYNSTVTTWSKGLTPATLERIGSARVFAEDLSAAGGTNIEEALIQAAALSEQQVADSDRNGNGHTVPSNRPLYIVFLTDGLPTAGNSDPDDLIDLSNTIMAGSTRLFTWGVGYDVNAYLLDQLARNHNGMSMYVEPFQNLESNVSAFFERISSPVLADLKLGIEGVDVYDMFPRALPDLFRGSEITVMGRYRRSGTATIDLGGMRDENSLRTGRSFHFRPVEEKADFLAPLWAQRKVGYLLEQIRLNGESEELRSEVTALGEKFGLVTPYTSFLVTEPAYDMNAQMRGGRNAEVAFMTDIPTYSDRGLRNTHFRSTTPVPGTGTVRGRVTDADTGNPAAAVNIFLLLTDDTATTMGAFTNPDGEYVIINVPPGRYNVRATMAGYETVSYDDQQVVADMNSIRDISLNPSTLNTGNVVIVTAEREMIRRDVATTQRSYSVEEMERMAVSSTAQILQLQTNTLMQPPDSTYYTNQAGSRTQVGQSAVRSSVSERDYQTSTTLIGSEGLGVRRVDNKTFRLDGETEVWRDDALKEDAEFTDIEIGSEEFMSLWKKFESLPDYAAIGEIVEVLLGDRGYRIIVPESP